MLDQHHELNHLVSEMKKNLNVPFERFYNLTKQQVFYLIFSYVRRTDVAEDLLQDTYIAFIGSLHGVMVSLNPLAYLLSTARNKAIDYLRKEKNVKEVSEESWDYLGSTEFVYDDTSGLLQRVASLLSPFEFRVYTLRVLGDMSFKEMSHLTHRPIGTLTYTYHIAIQKLQKGLTKDGEWKN